MIYALCISQAPPHTADATQSWCEENMDDFLTKDQWPSQSPDCNPLDYSVWGRMVDKLSRRPHSSVAAMKQTVSQVWEDEMTPEYLRNVCGSFRSRLEKVVAVGGGVFE